MGILEWLGQKISEFLSIIEPSITSGVLLIWGGGLYAMNETGGLTVDDVFIWSVIALAAWGLAWGFKSDAGLLDE